MSIQSVDKLKCSGCHACKAICPEKCIDMRKNSEGFLYPEVDKDKCIDCNLCERICPILNMDGNSNIIETFAAINKNEDCRSNSSSGGVFSLFAEYILKNQGLVYGAIMSIDCKSVYHFGIETTEELYKLRGSKYVQSVIGDIFVDIKQKLENGKKVLFSGTPCQVAGLKKYLSKNYSNLFLIDIICHGVPSEMLWQCYINYTEQKNKAKIKEVNFRYKQTTWQEYGIRKIDYYGKSNYISKNEDAYMNMFLKNYCLRESCYNCSTKKVRYADITLGDFWGIENIKPEMNDGKGTSAVIIRTKQGMEIWNAVRDELINSKVTYEDIVSHNSAEYMSVNRPVQRNYFFEDVNNMNFPQLIKKYIPVSYKRKIYNTLMTSPVGKIIKMMGS